MYFKYLIAETNRYDYYKEYITTCEAKETTIKRLDYVKLVVGSDIIEDDLNT